jgi:preprotein translocase subunit SecF
MQPRPPTVSGRVVAMVVLALIIAVVGIAIYVFLLKNPLHSN